MKSIINQWYAKVSDSVMARRSLLSDKWSYDYGVIWKGMERTYNLTKDEKYYNYIKNSMDEFINEDGTINGYSVDEYNIDHISNGKTILYLYNKTGEEKYKKAAELLYSQLKTHPRTTEGGFWHKEIYPNQMWLDGLYMGSPFYIEYAKTFGNEEMYDDVANQFIICYKHTVDEKTGLMYHAWDEKKIQFWCNKETGCSENFWGRAMGWYMVAIVDVLDFLPKNHKKRDELISIYKNMVEAVMKVRDEKSGVWYQVLDMGYRRGNYLESSCSAMFCYAITKGVKDGYLDEEYREVAKDIYKSLVEEFIEVRNDGLVNFNKTCEVAGLGNKDKRDGSFAYYLSESIICNDLKGVGAFIMASAISEDL